MKFKYEIPGGFAANIVHAMGLTTGIVDGPSGVVDGELIAARIALHEGRPDIEHRAHSHILVIPRHYGGPKHLFLQHLGCIQLIMIELFEQPRFIIQSEPLNLQKLLEHGFSKAVLRKPEHRGPAATLKDPFGLCLEQN